MYKLEGYVPLPNQMWFTSSLVWDKEKKSESFGHLPGNLSVVRKV